MNYLIVLLSLSTTLINAQSLLFESKVYFEDAMGNRDTIEIGYDTMSNSEYNPNLGELHIPHAFDSVFEVRASHIIAWDQNFRECVLSKRIIGAASEIIDISNPNANCYGGEGIIFFIKAKYPPVRLSWDSTLFQRSGQTCHAASFFTPDNNYHLSNPMDWIRWPNKRFACAGKQMFFDVNLDPGYTKANYAHENTFYTSRVFSNGIEDTVYGLELVFELRYDLSPCSLISKNDNSEPGIEVSQQFTIVPNPATDRISLEFDRKFKIDELIIFNQNGQIVKEIKEIQVLNKSIQIELPEVKPGMYFIKLKSEGEQSIYKRFLVLKSPY